MKPALLFDIDGTLLHAKGIGRPAFARAFEAAYHHAADFSQTSFVGATDTAVIRATATALGLTSSPAQEEAFYIALSHSLDDALRLTPPYVYPGVAAFLQALLDRGYVLGLVTGNIRPTAWSKLLHAGLAPYFSFGAYSGDHHDRNALAQLAVQRAHALGYEVKALIGDTPKDIQAAQAIDVPAIAVATGWIDKPTLLAAGATVCIDGYEPCTNALTLLEEALHAS